MASPLAVGSANHLPGTQEPALEGRPGSLEELTGPRCPPASRARNMVLIKHLFELVKKAELCTGVSTFLVPGGSHSCETLVCWPFPGAQSAELICPLQEGSKPWRGSLWTGRRPYTPAGEGVGSSPFVLELHTFDLRKVFRKPELQAQNSTLN